MDLRTTRSKLMPMVGGMTAAAAVVGAVAPMAHVAPAGAEAGGASPALGTAGLLGAGTLQGCEAYFGYGKEEGALGLVEFDVADVNGDDGVDHAVPTDTDVLLVLENETDDLLECVPEELDEATWDDQYGGVPFLPPYPGPGHYIYPSVALRPQIEGFGTVTYAGFRVAGIPLEHTLVSPEGTKELAELFFDVENDLFFGDTQDPAVLDLIASEVGADAAAAYAAALTDCSDDVEIDGTDPVLLAGVNLLGGLFDPEFGTRTETDCFEVHFLHAITSTFLSLYASVDYVEEIRLSLPEAPTPPAAPPATAPGAAQPVSAAPLYTG